VFEYFRRSYHRNRSLRNRRKQLGGPNRIKRKFDRACIVCGTYIKIGVILARRNCERRKNSRYRGENAVIGEGEFAMRERMWAVCSGAMQRELSLAATQAAKIHKNSLFHSRIIARSVRRRRLSSAKAPSLTLRLFSSVDLLESNRFLSLISFDTRRVFRFSWISRSRIIAHRVKREI